MYACVCVCVCVCVQGRAMRLTTGAGKGIALQNAMHNSGVKSLQGALPIVLFIIIIIRSSDFQSPK